MQRDFLRSKVWMTFVERSPFTVTLSNPDYVLAIDDNKEHFNKENAHWHLCFKGNPVARISAYGCWMSWPQVPNNIRLEAEAVTYERMIDIILACGKRPVSEPVLLASCRPSY